MSESDHDPRVYFAAERTLLAWIRTGVSVMAFGFVVARFGLFLRLLRSPAGREMGHGLSPYLGAALVGLGVLATAAGAMQYRTYFGSLPRTDRPASSRPRFVLGLSWALVVIGFVLVVILLI